MHGTILYLLVFLCSAHALKILCVFPGLAHSHYTLGRSLVKELTSKGHEVTFIAPYEEKGSIKNLRTIAIAGLEEEKAERQDSINLFEFGNIPAFIAIPLMGSMGFTLVDKTLSDEKVQKLLNSDEKFDLVIMEQFVTDGLQAIAYHFGAPSVVFSTIPASVWSNHLVGNPDIPSYMANVFLESPVHVSFCKRMGSFLIYLFQKLYDHLYFYPKQNQIMHKHFPNFPHIYDLMYNTSLVLLNSDVSFSEPVPHVPNMIPIGGYHVEPPEKLPEDLQNFLDSAKDGVVYFSMGSNLKSKDIAVEKREGILRALSKLKEKVLWKFEEDLPGKPANVEIRKWLPQKDILAHPNIKLFITHGGILGTIEALYYGVPLLGIPIFGDQRTNMANSKRKGYGLMIDYTELTEETLSNALDEVLNNPKYSQNAKHGSKLMHDQQVKPGERAVFWLEYVARHKGAPHLRSAALDLNWYQYASVDVILLLVAVTVILFFVFYKIIRWLLNRKKITKKRKTN